MADSERFDDIEGEVIPKMNEKHAVVFNGGKLFVLTETKDPETGENDVELSNLADFRTFYRNRLVRVRSRNKDGETVARRKNPADIWIDHPDRREYHKIVFNPSKPEIPKCYNLWKGFAVEADASGSCERYLEHILENICSGNRAYYDWLIDWLADIVQNPGGDRPGTAVALRGPQGTGKGVFVHNFGAIFGRHYKHIADQGQFVGRFNGHLKDSIFVFADEAIWGGSKESEGRLKAMITEPTTMIEQKYKDSIALKNHARFIIASNNSWFVPAGLEERRFFVLDVSDRHMQDKPYFKAIVEEMKNGGIQALFHFLKHRTITSDLRTAPKTESLFSQIKESMDSVQSFWFECLDQGRMFDGESWPDTVPTQKLHAKYLDHCERQKERHPEPNSVFGDRLMKFAPGVRKGRPRTITGEREYVYKIPYLEECRDEFEKTTGISGVFD